MYHLGKKQSIFVPWSTITFYLENVQIFSNNKNNNMDVLKLLRLLNYSEYFRTQPCLQFLADVSDPL